MVAPEAEAALLAYLEKTHESSVLEALVQALGYEKFANRRDVLELPSVIDAIGQLSGKPVAAAPFIDNESNLAGLTSLEWLNLSGTQVSDVSPLAGLTSLRYLLLAGTHVSDVSQLAGLTSLGSLNLSGTQVLDVSPLAGLTLLKWLDLSGTLMSEKDVRRLRQALPNCNIFFESIG